MIIKLVAYTYNLGFYSLGGPGRPLELEALDLDADFGELDEAIETWQDFLGPEYIIEIAGYNPDADLKLEDVLEEIQEFLGQ